MNIAKEIKSVMDEWNLSLDQVSAVTTDNASNMVLAMELLESIRLQLAVEDALKLPKVAQCRPDA